MPVAFENAMSKSVFLVLVTFALISTVATADEPAVIRVDAAKTIAHVRRYMTGACLEDVNHEVYGGIYSQMVFGESFQEPPPPPPVKDFKAYAGHWQVTDGVASVEADKGPKLVSNHAAVGDGEVGVEVFLPGTARGVAGLIVAVRDAGVGMDRFAGYEISLSNEPGFVLLGRPRQNWEPTKNVPYAGPTDQWGRLAV